MTIIVMDIDGCDIAHEALMLEEYGNEVMCAGWFPQLSLAVESPIAQDRQHANGRGGTALPNVILPSALVEVGDSFSFVRSKAFPKCP